MKNIYWTVIHIYIYVFITPTYSYISCNSKAHEQTDDFSSCLYVKRTWFTIVDRAANVK